MTNNDVFKKLRVALMLRDDDIIEILKLVDFNIGKSELGAFFRREDHPNYMECGDQVLRNFLNGLVIYLRGTKENPTLPGDVLSAMGTSGGKQSKERTGREKSSRGKSGRVPSKKKSPETKKTTYSKSDNKKPGSATRPSFKDQQRQNMDTDITPVKYKNKLKDRK